jgi:hypothetical protein
MRPSAKQIPGDDPDKNADTFGDREVVGTALPCCSTPDCPLRVSLVPVQQLAVLSAGGCIARLSASPKKCSRVWRALARICAEFIHFVLFPFLLSSCAAMIGMEAGRLQCLRQVFVTDCNKGQASVKRAPPSGDWAAVALPPCCSRTSRAMARPSP